MAKKCWIAREKKREQLREKYAEKIKALKEAGDYEGLSKIPRNAFSTRRSNRCAITGRSRGYHRKFGISRIALRELASNGEIPGVTKASW
jgi:small subunit ribosomal protein S14